MRPELLIRSKACAVVIVLPECCQEFCAVTKAKFAICAAEKRRRHNKRMLCRQGGKDLP